MAKKTIIAIIPARGNSKGIANKNIVAIKEKPLVAYTIEAAVKSGIFDRIIVTTDCHKIAQVSKKSGAEVVIRPKKLAKDTSPTEPAMDHVLDQLWKKEGYRPDSLMLLQPTSPLRDHNDIRKAYAKFRKDKLDSLLSGSSHVSFIWKIEKDRVSALNYDYLHRPRRQDIKDQFKEDGAIYITKYRTFKKYKNRLGGEIGVYLMDEKRSLEVDTPVDLAIIKTYLEHGKNK
jgi:N-acylneuraminate cytidylyltransferase